MKKCILKEYQRWDICPYHKNSKGGHGDYRCVYIYPLSYKVNAPQYCKLKEFELPEELFVI